MFLIRKIIGHSNSFWERDRVYTSFLRDEGKRGHSPEARHSKLLLLKLTYACVCCQPTEHSFQKRTIADNPNVLEMDTRLHCRTGAILPHIWGCITGLQMKSYKSQARRILRLYGGLRRQQNTDRHCAGLGHTYFFFSSIDPAYIHMRLGMDGLPLHGKAPESCRA